MEMSDSLKNYSPVFLLDGELLPQVIWLEAY